jgi:hypothetical protein
MLATGSSKLTTCWKAVVSSQLLSKLCCCFLGFLEVPVPSSWNYKQQWLYGRTFCSAKFNLDRHMAVLIDRLLPLGLILVLFLTQEIALGTHCLLLGVSDPKEAALDWHPARACRFEPRASVWELSAVWEAACHDTNWQVSQYKNSDLTDLSFNGESVLSSLSVLCFFQFTCETCASVKRNTINKFLLVQ